MATPTHSLEEIQQTIRNNRSSESNFSLLVAELDKAIAASESSGQSNLATDLKEVKEKYAPIYLEAKESSGTAWPEFENFVTQFERCLTEAKNSPN
jgi:hypothetical protein